MEILILLVSVLVILFVFWKMMSFTFGLIDRAHERLREESRNAGTNLVRERGD